MKGESSPLELEIGDFWPSQELAFPVAARGCLISPGGRGAWS